MASNLLYLLEKRGADSKVEKKNRRRVGVNMKKLGMKNKKFLSAGLLAALLVLTGCGKDNNNNAAGYGVGAYTNCGNGVDIHGQIPIRIDGGYLGSSNLLVGVATSPFGSTGSVTVGQSAGGNVAYASDPYNNLYGSIQVSLTAQYSGGQGGSAVGGGIVTLSQQAIQQLETLYGYNQWQGSGWQTGGQNTTTCIGVAGMSINLGVSSNINPDGSRRLYGGVVTLNLNRGSPYSLGF